MNQPNGRTNYTSALIALTVLFFMWGLITSLNDILVPHLKALFTLSYLQAMLVQFCFFAAYFVMSVPSGFVIERIGYKRGIVLGLVTAGVGCLLFFPAAALKSYPFFLVALFVLASGIACLQVAANPYVTALGTPQTASSRLNLTQAFNSLGTTLGPMLGSVLILAVAVKSASELQALTPDQLAAYESAQAHSVETLYIGLAVVLFAIAVFIALYRLPHIENSQQDMSQGVQPARRSVWAYPHLVLGVVAIFAYVGAEVSIGSFMVSLLSQPTVAALTQQTAGHYLSIYWGLAMLGRFMGSALMRRIKPNRLLTFNAVINILLVGGAMTLGGHAAMWGMLAVGLFNSIMFPTIFSLALTGLGRFTSEGSGLLCMAIVGGAVMPVVQGYVADHAGLFISYVVPLVCYAYIVFYGARGCRPR